MTLKVMQAPRVLQPTKGLCAHRLSGTIKSRPLDALGSLRLRFPFTKK